jgi:hypothetical protein
MGAISNDLKPICEGRQSTLSIGGSTQGLFQAREHAHPTTIGYKSKRKT